MVSVNGIWLRWAMARAEKIRKRLREVTGIYNQWPIILGENTHYLPIGRLPESIVCLANDNQ